MDSVHQVVLLICKHTYNEKSPREIQWRSGSNRQDIDQCQYTDDATLKARDERKWAGYLN